MLPVPSHVVLHHLSTSAIRNGVLAVGNTTRYKKKVRHLIPKYLMCISRPLFIVHHDDLLQADVMVRAAESHKITVSVQG